MGPEVAAASEAAVEEMILGRGIAIIDGKTGTIADYRPSETTLKALAPKFRSIGRAKTEAERTAAEEKLEGEVRKIVEQKASNNLTAAKMYLTRALGAVASKLPLKYKEQAAAILMPALLAEDTAAAEAIMKAVKAGEALNAMENANTKAMVARKTAKTVAKGSILEEVAAAIAAANPEFAGYVPTAANITQYQVLKNAESLNRMNRYLAKEDVAARIRAALAKKTITRVSKKAMRNVSPLERVLLRANANAATRNIGAYFGNNSAIAPSNVARLAEIRARGLALTAENYFKMVRPAFTIRKAKKASNASNAAGAGAGAGAKPRGRTRKAKTPAANTVANAVANAAAEMFAE